MFVKRSQEWIYSQVIPKINIHCIILSIHTHTHTHIYIYTQVNHFALNRLKWGMFGLMMSYPQELAIGSMNEKEGSLIFSRGALCARECMHLWPLDNRGMSLRSRIPGNESLIQSHIPPTWGRYNIINYLSLSLSIYIYIYIYTLLLSIWTDVLFWELKQDKCIEH